MQALISELDGVSVHPGSTLLGDDLRQFVQSQGPQLPPRPPRTNPPQATAQDAVTQDPNAFGYVQPAATGGQALAGHPAFQQGPMHHMSQWLVRACLCSRDAGVGGAHVLGRMHVPLGGRTRSVRAAAAPQERRLPAPALPQAKNLQEELSRLIALQINQQLGSISLNMG